MLVQHDAGMLQKRGEVGGCRWPLRCGDKREEARTQELFAPSSEVATVGVIDKGQGRIWQKPANELRLLLDYGPVPLLALLRIVYRLFELPLMTLILEA